MFDGKQITRKLVGSEDERAVSPVIGVILMVAITVILAAVIAAFVLDLGGSVGEEPQAGVSVEPLEGTNVSVSVTSMGNSDGVAVVNSSGGVVEQWDMDDDDVVADNYAHIQSTGGQIIVNTDGNGNSANNVVAYIGPDVGENATSLDAAEATATVANVN